MTNITGANDKDQKPLTGGSAIEKFPMIINIKPIASKYKFFLPKGSPFDLALSFLTFAIIFRSIFFHANTIYENAASS